MQSPKKLTAIFIVIAFACVSWFNVHPDTKNVYTSKGRTETLTDGSIVLIGSASSVTFGFKGTDCNLMLTAVDVKSHHNYAVITVDGQYYSREKIEPTGTSIVLKVPAGNHVLTIYKATEAGVGQVIFNEATGDLYNVDEKQRNTIEFIGDSITCGMGNDTLNIPCGKGQWFDQHNAYYSYAAITARNLNADFVLSSVSGIGIYRNWNDEHNKEAIMPDVYENLYLNKDASKRYAFNFSPNITCIALGTNDFSDGDGMKPRMPFSEEKFVAGYVQFIQTVYKHAPDTQIVLLDSPMINGAKAKIFTKCLNAVQQKVNSVKGHKPVIVFSFNAVTPHGCGFHPEIEDDKLMAAQLSPYLQKLLK